MERFTKSLIALVAIMAAVSISAAPRQKNEPAKPPANSSQQKQTTSSPWLRLIHKILDDVIPPPESKLSVPPG